MQEKTILNADRFALDTVGICVESLEPTRCSMVITDKHRNARDMVMGGAVFTLADYTFGVAANQNDVVTVTQNARIDYLRAVGNGKLTATAECIKDGKTACVYSVRITDDLGREIAHVIFSGIHLAG